MLTIWGRASSMNVRKVLWCAEELGLAYEHIPAGAHYGVVDSADFRALNPNGLVPLIRDGDVVLWESNTIVRYLGAAYGDEGFAPTDAARRAQAEKWMDWTSIAFARPFRDVFWNLVRASPEQRNDEEIARGTKEGNRLLATVDHVLATQPFLSGDDFGIGDIPLGTLLHGWFGLPIDHAELPALAAWQKRLEERVAYGRIALIPLA